MELGISFVDVDVEKLRKEQRKQKKKVRKEEEKHNKSTSAEPTKVKEADHADQIAVPEATSGMHTSPDDKEGVSEPLEVRKASRDDWMTAKSGRNILTGHMTETSASPSKPEAKRPEKAPDLQAGLNQGQGGTRVAAPTSFGDGGASWRLKALRRAEAQAAEEGRDLDSLVSERFGSLSALTDSLVQQKTAHPKAHLHASSDRARQHDDSKGASYLQDLNAKRMQRPQASASAMWSRKEKAQATVRKGESNADQCGHHKKDRHGEQSPADSNPARAKALLVQNKEHKGTEEPRRRIKTASGERDVRGNGQTHRPAGLNPGSQAVSSFLDRLKPESQAEQPIGGQSSEKSCLAGSGNREPFSKDLLGEEGVAKLADGDNRGAAALLRAKLMGTASSGKPSRPSDSKTSKSKVEVLPSVDMDGRALPGTFGREAAGTGLTEGGRKPKRLQRYKAGEKEIFFANDDRSLDDLVREQRHGGGKNIDDNLADNIARKAKFRERDLDVDDEYDIDGGLEMYEGRDTKATKEKAVKRQRLSQIADLRKMDRALDNCNLCFGSARLNKHLIIAIAQTAYLSIPNRARLAPLHCCIAPVEHISSSRKTDEHVWTEMRNFKKCILQMFASQASRQPLASLDVDIVHAVADASYTKDDAKDLLNIGLNAIFIETAMRLTDRRSHAVVHCVPLDDKAFHRAPIVFKKAMLEAESEWSQHHAKAAIDTKSKGLRGSIPPNFPYFFVEFGLSAGSLHVIDNEEKFDKDFGRSILSGLLGLGAEKQHRGAKAEPEAIQRQLHADFAAMFDRFDWTKQLD